MGCCWSIRQKRKGFVIADRYAESCFCAASVTWIFPLVLTDRHGVVYAWEKRTSCKTKNPYLLSGCIDSFLGEKTKKLCIMYTINQCTMITADLQVPFVFFRKKHAAQRQEYEVHAFSITGDRNVIDFHRMICYNGGTTTTLQQQEENNK